LTDGGAYRIEGHVVSQSWSLWFGPFRGGSANVEADSP
jgi:hypothetical protein